MCRCWLPGIVTILIRARQSELHFDYICFLSVYEGNIKQTREKGLHYNDKQEYFLIIFRLVWILQSTIWDSLFLRSGLDLFFSWLIVRFGVNLRRTRSIVGFYFLLFTIETSILQVKKRKSNNKTYKDNVELDEGLANGLVVPMRLALNKI